MTDQPGQDPKPNPWGNTPPGESGDDQNGQPPANETRPIDAPGGFSVPSFDKSDQPPATPPSSPPPYSPSFSLPNYDQPSSGSGYGQPGGAPPPDPAAQPTGFDPAPPPPPTGFDPPPAQPGGYGSPPQNDPQNPYGAPATPTSGAYGGYDPGAYNQPTSGAYGAQPTSGAYGPQPTSGYGPPPSSGGPPNAGGYGPPPGFGGSVTGAAAPYGTDPYGMPVPPKNDPMAMTAMGVGIGAVVIGACTFCCGYLAFIPFLGGIAAVILGIVARNNINKSGGAKTGSGQALAGIITGAVAVLLAIVVTLFLILGFATAFSDLGTSGY